MQRHGNPDIVAEVLWSTQNCSIDPSYYGDKGKDMSGTLRFEKGELSKELVFRFPDDKTRGSRAGSVLDERRGPLPRRASRERRGALLPRRASRERRGAASFE